VVGRLVDLGAGGLDVAVDLVTVLGRELACLLTRLLGCLRRSLLQLPGLRLEVELLGLLPQPVQKRHRHSVLSRLLPAAHGVGSPAGAGMILVLATVGPTDAFPSGFDSSAHAL